MQSLRFLNLELRVFCLATKEFPLIRDAVPEDISEIQELIMQLAIQEGLPEHVHCTDEQLLQALFEGGDTPLGKPCVFVKVVEHPTGPKRLAAFTLFWYDFPTWSGKHGIYIEDICVREELRGQGYGSYLMSHLAQICVNSGFSRLAWWVKNSNTTAIEFYERMNANIMDHFTVRHLEGEGLHELAKGI